MTSLWIFVLILNITPVQSVDFSKPKFLSVKSGERVTFNCRIGDNLRGSSSVYWYKQMFGEMPQIVGERVAYKDKIYPEFETSGYKMETTDEGISLTIQHAKKEHGGLYYCEISYWYQVMLFNGTLLAVTDDRDVKVSVIQSSVSDSVPTGASVTLQCSVLSESRAVELQVLWFRAAPPQSHPQIIYTHHNSSHQCESSSSTHTCVYNFSKNILSVSDTGKINLSLKESVDPVVICLAVALGVCVLVIFVQAVLFSKWRNSEQPTKTQNTVKPPEQTLPQDRNSVELNYAALHFKDKKTKTRKKNKGQPQDSVYSEVRSFTTA